MPFAIDLWLIHPEPVACLAFNQRFDGMPNVQVIKSRFEDLAPHDCFVTAANCYGIMSAGIDAAVTSFHGEKLCRAIQHRILDEYLGEQPVGTAMIQETGNQNYPYVCHAPTMRTPGSITRTDNVYQAAFAAFTSVYRHNVSSDHKIKSVVFPTMGCGFGGMEYSESARQMAAAYKHYLNPPHRFDWDTVTSREKAICYDGKKKVTR
ncbi:MAG: phage tail protein [Blastopirellula sp.]|nr:MAG: phage tail protein [Blastopirellula sp.]